jgi:sec-independent protein translocase protein TatC
MRKIQRQPRPHGQKRTNKPETTPEIKAFSDHIGEFRRRIFFVALVFFAASSVAYSFREQLVQLIMSPLGDEKLIYLTPGGGFNFIFQVSLYAGLITAAPMLVYQVYGFIRPALPSRAQRSSGKVVLASFLLMLAGVLFGYYIAVPSALNFLSTFAGANIAPSLTADSYLGFFLAYIAGLGILFQLPLLLLFWHWIKPMTPGGLLKSERFVILFAFVAAAIITPTPDVLNQCMIAVPLIAIYQLGVVAVLIMIRKDKRRVRRQAEAEITRPSVVRPPQSVETVSSSQAVTSSLVTHAKTKSTAMPVLRQAVSGPPTIRLAAKSIDGFGTRRAGQARMLVPARTPSRQQASRPVGTSYRRPLSIDGFIS